MSLFLLPQEFCSRKMMVHRHTAVGAGRTRSETCDSMSSLEGVRAAELPAHIRGHWDIENRSHWVLDAVYREGSQSDLRPHLGGQPRHPAAHGTQCPQPHAGSG
jgi:hypothetical protein